MLAVFFAIPRIFCRSPLHNEAAPIVCAFIQLTFRASSTPSTVFLSFSWVSLIFQDELAALAGKMTSSNTSFCTISFSFRRTVAGAGICARPWNVTISVTGLKCMIFNAEDFFEITNYERYKYSKSFSKDS